MKRYEIRIERGAQKWLAKLRDRKTLERIGAAIDKLAEDPRPMGAEKLSGHLNRYRFRVGVYRILYEIHDAVLVVLIVDIGDRKEIYR
ncbi:MAG: type II toxin-antitoxin system RelE/ParE family toxin [Verrucomicrobiota bacterium]|nr:type II toxin-antitoxin system RelE/ParE family toxin [Verrucomicrobiota bacterium]